MSVWPALCRFCNHTDLTNTRETTTSCRIHLANHPIMSIHFQTQAKFFAAPTEIRHAIYKHLVPSSVHLSIHGASFHFSQCVRKGDDENPPIYIIRRTSDDAHAGSSPDPHYARSLRSSWCEHWRCEERALEHGAEESVDATLSVCKRM